MPKAPACVGRIHMAVTEAVVCMDKNNSKKCELPTLFMNWFQAYINAENRQKFPKNALQAVLKAWWRPSRMPEKPFLRFIGLFSGMKSAYSDFMQSGSSYGFLPLYLLLPALAAGLGATVGRWHFAALWA